MIKIKNGDKIGIVNIYIGDKKIHKENIYVKEKAVLGRSHITAFNTLGYKLGEEAQKEFPDENIREEILDVTLCDGLSILEENEKYYLVVEGNADKKAITDWLKECELSKTATSFIKGVLKDAKPRKQTPEETEGGRKWMCSSFYDIRTFGAVLSLKSAPNCGQVRGPIQFTFARSVDPIMTSEHSITRMAVATEKEAEKQGGDNRTMGRKATIPYGLYVCHGFISANLAKQTGFSEEDLDLFWDALKNMFDMDRSAARGLMSAQKLIVFKHDSVLGNAPANKLFELVKVNKTGNGVPRCFEDYKVTIEKDNCPAGVTIIEMI